MPLSVTDPIGQAFERTKLILFQPFDFGKWLRLGFCAFLMSLAQGGGGGGGPGGNWSGNNGNEEVFGDGNPFEPAIQWVGEHLMLVIVVAVAIFLLGIALSLVLTWLSSRGRFMFLDGVIRNRGAVVEPWHEFSSEGNSLFVFRFCLGIGSLLLVLVLLGLCALIALPDIQEGEFGGFAAAGIAVGILLLVAFGLLMGIITLLLNDFVVPIMYLNRIPVIPAWKEFSASMLAGNVLTFVLYFLIRFVLNLAVGIAAVMAFCLTCCLAALPFVSSVVLLPFTVFLQAYPLYFIEQFGPKWHVFPVDPPLDTGLGKLFADDLA